MPTHLVVLGDADVPRLDDGRTLARFLQRFAPADVTVVTPAEVLAGAPRTADVVYVAQPSTFAAPHADRIRARRWFAFDYFDESAPHWTPATRADLAPRMHGYLKTHRRTGAAHEVPIGLLPIAYNPSVRKNVRRWRRRAPLRALDRLLGREERPWDVSLLGSVTFLDEVGPDGSRKPYHQRVAWWREVQAHPAWRRWGGLTPLPYCSMADVERTEGPCRELFRTEPPMRFRTYFRELARTKVSLAPAGHARWTYRHVESVYAGCNVVSTDLRGIETLVPAPADCFDLVPDHAPVTPVIEQALAEHAERAGRRAAALAHLERWLRDGNYDRARTAPWSAFMAQLGV